MEQCSWYWAWDFSPTAHEGDRDDPVDEPPTLTAETRWRSALAPYSLSSNWLRPHSVRNGAPRHFVLISVACVVMRLAGR